MIFSAGIQTSYSGYRFTRLDNFPYWTLAMVKTGRLRVEFSGQAIDVVGPRLQLIEPDTPYTLHCLEDSINAWVAFTPRQDWITLLKWPEKAKGVGVLEYSGFDKKTEIENNFSNIVDLFNRPLPNNRMFAFNELERLLLNCSLSNPRDSFFSYDERIKKAIELMGQYRHRNIDIRSMASSVNMSESRFSHLFREQTGISPAVFHMNLRLELAGQLLVSTSFSLVEIAEKTGFRNQFHFMTKFKKVFGTTPGAYRKNVARQPS